MSMSLKLTKNDSIISLADSFDNLPETDHLDGKYRLRRYSVVRCNGACVDTGENTFTQSKEYNKFQGDMIRKFEPVEPEVINSIEMLRLCSEFAYSIGIHEDNDIHIHQMRVVVSGDDYVQVSPEGVHQDGYDYICVAGIQRYNVEGGCFLAYFEKDEDHFASLPLEGGMTVIVNDKSLWHNASPIKSKDGSLGYVDSFILTAKIFE